MIKISVVIPVYNVENHLAECLDSILNQSLSDIEVICINDGSEDNSLTILDQYAQNDSRLKILSQDNQGVSAARNAGLEVAQGKYVSFVDGDDTIDKDFLLNLYNTIEIHGVDVVFSKLFEKENFNQFLNILGREEIRNTLLRFFIKDAQFYSVCNKLFSNSIIQRNGLRFPYGVKLGEDGHFNIQFLICSEKVFFFDYCGYHYREVDESATRNIFKHNYIQKAVEAYMIDWTPLLGDIISSEEIQHLKKAPFVKKIISLTYNYANPKSGLSFKKRLAKLKEIINNQEVSTVFSDISLKKELNLTRYKEAIFDGIRNRNIFYIYILTLFSYYRNK